MEQVAKARYVNPGDAPIEFSIGNAPGEPPTVYRCSPGGTVDGPAAYVEAFRRAGLVLEGRAPAKRPAPAPGAPEAPAGDDPTEPALATKPDAKGKGGKGKGGKGRQKEEAAPAPADEAPAPFRDKG